MTSEKKSRSITWGKRLVLTLLILAGVFYGVLNLAERSKDSIRLGLQDYLEKATGHRAVITDMVSVELSPDMEFKMRGIVLQDRSDEEKILLNINEAHIKKPFLHVLTGQQDYINLEVKDVEIAGGYMFPLKMVINFAGISDPEGQIKSPVFLLEGLYNSKSILITLELSRKAKENHNLYSLLKISPFTFKIGDIEASGTFQRDLRHISLKDVILTRKGYEVSFNMDNIRINPLSGDFSGHINDIPVKGSLTSSGDDISLTIDPIQDAKNHKIVDDFVMSVKKDLAIENDNTGFQIKLTDKKNASQIKE